MKKLGCSLELRERVSLTIKEKTANWDIHLSREKNHVDNLKNPWMFPRAKRKIVSDLQRKESQLRYSLEKPTGFKNRYQHK